MIVEVHTAPVDHLAEPVWRCFRAVFGDDGDLAGFRAEIFDRHAARAGYRLVTATEGEEVVGFAWGYVGAPGQYWTDLATAALPDDVARAWVGGHFELVELGVAPGRRGRGLGRLLHDRLLAGVDRRCLLSTADDPGDPAVRLYAAAGWRRLGRLTEGVQVMGREAPPVGG